MGKARHLQLPPVEDLEEDNGFPNKDLGPRLGPDVNMGP